MPHSMAAEGVPREQDYVQHEKERPDADRELPLWEESLDSLVPEKGHHYYRSVEEVPVDVVEDPEIRLTIIILWAPRLPLLGLAGAVRGIPKEGPVVRLAVVIAREPEP